MTLPALSAVCTVACEAVMEFASVMRQMVEPKSGSVMQVFTPVTLPVARTLVGEQAAEPI
jgi:hypothetical protein